MDNQRSEKIMEEYREEVSDLRRKSYPQMSVNQARKIASEYMLNHYSKEELKEAIINDKQMQLFGMEKSWLNALGKAKKMANGSIIDGGGYDIVGGARTVYELSVPELETQLHITKSSETERIKLIKKLIEEKSEKYAKGGLVGYKPLYLLFNEGNTATIRLFRDNGHNDYSSLGDIGFYKIDNKYQMSRLDISDSMSYKLVDTLKIMTKVMSYLKDKVGSYADITEVLSVLKGEELIVADIGGGQTYFLPKSYIGYHVFNVYEKGRDSLYSRIFAPNTLKAQKMLDVKMKSYGGANRYDIQSTGNTVRNSRTDIQFGVGGNMEDKYYGGGAIDFGSNYADYSIGGL